jgi:hypothetical protein
MNVTFNFIEEVVPTKETSKQTETPKPKPMTRKQVAIAKQVAIDTAQKELDLHLEKFLQHIAKLEDLYTDLDIAEQAVRSTKHRLTIARKTALQCDLLEGKALDAQYLLEDLQLEIVYFERTRDRMKRHAEHMSDMKRYNYPSAQDQLKLNRLIERLTERLTERLIEQEAESEAYRLKLDRMEERMEERMAGHEAELKAYRLKLERMEERKVERIL